MAAQGSQEYAQDRQAEDAHALTEEENAQAFIWIVLLEKMAIQDGQDKDVQQPTGPAAHQCSSVDEVAGQSEQSRLSHIMGIINGVCKKDGRYIKAIFELIDMADSQLIQTIAQGLTTKTWGKTYSIRQVAQRHGVRHLIIWLLNYGCSYYMAAQGGPTSYSFFILLFEF
jgi:hypothetical protein